MKATCASVNFDLLVVALRRPAGPELKISSSGWRKKRAAGHRSRAPSFASGGPCRTAPSCHDRRRASTGGKGPFRLGGVHGLDRRSRAGPAAHPASRCARLTPRAPSDDRRERRIRRQPPPKTHDRSAPTCPTPDRSFVRVLRARSRPSVPECLRKRIAVPRAVTPTGRLSRSASRRDDHHQSQGIQLPPSHGPQPRRPQGPPPQPPRR